MPKKRKIRADFRKNREKPARVRDWTQQFAEHGFETSDPEQRERVSGKGDISRRRTVIGSEISTDDDGTFGVEIDVDESRCLSGRVLSAHGLFNVVLGADGLQYQCAVRRVLKTLATDERHVVVAGDVVLFQPIEGTEPREGVIERVQPRYGTLSRSSRGRKHVILANVDQLLIVGSAAEPRLKPNLIDRFLVSAEKSGIRPIICINKVDLVDRAALMPLVGVYSQMGYRVLLLSATDGIGIERLRGVVGGGECAVAGQSGVGKSSLLNALDPELQLKVSAVSEDSQKGKHTTTAARLVPLRSGGFVVDTPGIRPFELWDVIPEEVAGYFRDVRPFVSHCRFPNCTHTHETDCAVKDAVADDLIDARRYESYCGMVAGETRSEEHT
ncbi:MAG: ribosome small subunit-dependent GTPase A, partial [Planctomycetales bacterium]|nr:ribosome small subunit-dependent GTPase A [Planctomycetales bacterium]